MENFLAVAQTPAVHEIQEAKGSLGLYGTEAPPIDAIDPDEMAFIAGVDTVFMATVNEDGWPYVQHKGGAPGFVHQLGPTTIGWTERAGNRQYLGAGNVAANGRVALIFIDVARRMRLKALGAATYHAAIPDDLVDVLNPDGVRADGAFVVDVVATAWNCPKHITPRFTAEEVEAAVAPLHERIAELEARLAAAD